MKRPVKSGIASLKALGMVLALGAGAHASLPYLPLIGPPPLRVQVLKTPNPTASGEIQAAPVAATNSPAVAVVTTVPAVTNVAGDEAAAGLAAAAGPVADKPGEETSSTPVFALPTPDLLSITPQMLATYFRPVQFGTNAAALVGPFHVGFMPPQPAPEKSSRAEYIVK